MRFEHAIPVDPVDLRPMRAGLEAWCGLEGVGAQADDIVIIASELVANAVRHGTPPVIVTCSRGPRGIGVQVQQDNGASGSFPQLAPTAGTSPDGRGLLIVDRLAQAWGCRRTSTRTWVWALVAIAASDSTRDA